MTSADGAASACLTALFRGALTLVRVGPFAAVPFASIAFDSAGAAVAATLAGLFFATFFVVADFFAADFFAAELAFIVAVDSAVALDATFAAAFLRGARALGAGFAAGAAPSAICVSPSLDDARRFRGATFDAAPDATPDATPDAASSALADVFTEDRRWRTGLSADPAVVSFSLIAFGC